MLGPRQFGKSTLAHLYSKAQADKQKSQFLILGSASRDLIQQSSETLAGRISYIEVSPFSVIEKIEQRRLWNRGGFPRAYLLKSEKTSHEWVKNYSSLEIKL